MPTPWSLVRFFPGCVVLFGASVAFTADVPNAIAGKQYFRQQCALCHSAEAADNGGAQGPDLGGIFGRRAAGNSAFSYTPALLALHRETSSRWQRQVEEDGIDTTNASIVRFAADGLGWARLYGVPAPSEEVRASVIRALIALTQ